MLLGVARSAHLTPQVSSADSSTSRGEAAERPPPARRLTVAPAPLLGPAIGTPQRRAWSHALPLPLSRFRFLLGGGRADRHAANLKFEEVDKSQRSYDRAEWEERGLGTLCTALTAFTRLTCSFIYVYES